LAAGLDAAVGCLDPEPCAELPWAACLALPSPPDRAAAGPVSLASAAASADPLPDTRARMSYEATLLATGLVWTGFACA
jgi:hypothetical protein